MISLEALLSEHGSDVESHPVSLPEIGDDDLDSLFEAASALVQRDSQSAAALLARIAEEASRRSRTEMEASATYAQARAEVNLGRLSLALDSIDRARRAWLAAGSPLSALRTDLGRMHVLDDLGRHGEALEVGQALVYALEQLNSEDPEAVWMRAAALENLGVGHGYVGEHLKALDAYAAAEQIYRAHELTEEVPRPMANRGVELIELGRLQEATDALREAARGFESSGDQLSVAKCLAYEARAQFRSGNYIASMEALNRAEEYLSDQSAVTTEYARIQLVRAETLASINVHDRALELYGSLVDQFEVGGLPHDLAAALYGQAGVQARLGRAAYSIESYERAEQIYRTVGDQPMAAVAMLDRSRLLAATDGRELASAALSSLSQSARPADHAAALLRLSELADTGPEAAALLHQAKELVAARDLPHLRWQIMHREARWLQRNGDLAAARAAYERALEDIEQLRGTVHDEQFLMSFMGGRRHVHEGLVDLMLETGDVNAAFAQTEAARARTLIEALTGSTAVSSRDRRSVEVGALSPDSLEATGCVVTYEIVGSEILAYVVVDGEVTVTRELTTVDRIETLLSRLEAQWRRFDDVGLVARQHRHLVRATVDLLQTLYLELLARIPVAMESDSLLVVPAGLLANVPFGALHDGTCHLVERLAVTGAPSLTAVRAINGSRSGRRRLVIGVEDENAPRIRDEVDAVAEVGSGATVLVDDEATVDAFKAAVATHDIIHLACHGIHRPDNPLFSALRLGDRWLTAAEIGGMDFDRQLVVLSACASGRQAHLGSSDEVTGLPRAFLAAGAAAVVVNLWRADDAASAVLMADFQQNIEDGDAAPHALRRAQLRALDLNNHPYLWAPGLVYGAPAPRRETS